MNADQWRAVHKLHVEACKLPAEAQRAHVEQNCSGDPEVRDQVLALLAAGGTKPRMVGPYEVRHRIGHGGMGEVWSGWSPELKRDVALKFVRSGVDLDVLRREAEVQAQLQSPRICPVIDFVGPDRGGPCLVMELLEGETLDARINALRKAPVWRFPHLLETAQQIAEGLEHAHAKGVVHCDLKPGNIMLTPQGVRLLDFGIAKAGPDFAGTSSTRRLTWGYASPELMQHGDVQPPTDQFSFGAVFFEMATGIPAFSGEGLTTKIQALADYRDRTYLRNLHRVPWNFRGIVRRCLSWEPSGRYATTAELSRALAQAAKRPTRLWSALAAAALLAAAFGVYLSLPKARPLPTLTQITRDGGWTGDVSFDAACGRIVYASDRNAKGKTRIWTSASDGSNPQRQTGEECGAAVRPVFSPDGNAIFYHCADEDREGIYRLDLTSNKTVLVESHADHPSFSPNGDMAFYRANRAFSPLYVWSGGKVRELRKDYSAETTRRPVWSPNGKHLAFLGSPSSTGNALSVNSVEIYVLSLETGEVTQTNLMEQIRKETIYQRKFPLLLRWLEGRLIIGLKSRDNTDLWETAIDPTKPSRTAGLRRLTSSNDEIWSGDACGDRLVFDATDMRWDIGAVPAQSTGIAAGPLEMLTQDAAEDRSPNFGPGGREMLFLSNRDGKFGLYRQSLSAGGGDPGKLFERSGTVDRAQVSPDGSWIAIHQVETAGADRIIAARVDGSEASTICSQCGNLGGWFEDNQAIHAAWEKGPVYQIRKIDRASGQAIPLFEDRERVLGNERIAPGGRWMAFVATSPDWSVWQVFVAPVPVKGVTPSRDWIPVTGPGADELRIGWSPDGRLLYTRGGPARPTELFAQQIDFQTGRLSGPPKSIYRIASDLPGLILYQFVAGEKRVLFQMSQETSNLWSARF